jgi:hypothetical protein
MKKFTLTILFLGFFTAGVYAQTFSAEEFSRNLGKEKTLCDTVYSLKIFSDTLTLVNMGGIYPNQKYTVAIKGNRITLDWTTLKGKKMCVTGVFEMYKGKPEIEVNDPVRITVQ